MYMGNLLEPYFEGNGCEVNHPSDFYKIPYKYMELLGGSIGRNP